MKLVTVTTLALAAALSHSALAVHQIGFISSFDVMPSAPLQKTDSLECTDFSGSWKGACTTTEGKKVEEAFNIIQNDCSVIELTSAKHKVAIPVGGVLSIGGAKPGNPAMSFGADITSSWNKEKKVLSFYVMAGGKKLAIDEKGGGLALKQDIQLTDNKLTVEIVAMGSEGKKAGSCEFEKQSR